MDKLSYRRHRFPPIVIQQAVWYFRVALSYRDVEDMLAERGIHVSAGHARELKLRRRPDRCRRSCAARDVGMLSLNFPVELRRRFAGGHGSFLELLAAHVSDAIGITVGCVFTA